MVSGSGRWRGPAVALVTLGVALACGGAPDLENPATWSGHGLALSYPGNWTLTDGIAEGAIGGLVTIEDSSSAQIVVQPFGPDVAITPRGYADLLFGMAEDASAAVSGLAGVTDLTLEPVTRRIAGAEREGVRADYSLAVLGLQLAYTGEIYAVPAGDGTLIVAATRANEDARWGDAGIALVLDSLTVP